MSKATIPVETTAPIEGTVLTEKRKRGRPKGSKNKPSAPVAENNTAVNTEDNEAAI